MESGTIHPNLSSILREHRVFPPPAEFAAQAHVKSLEEYESLYRRSIEDPEGFWAEVARSSIGSHRGRRCSIGNLPGRSGLWAAKPISATTASIVTPSATRRTSRDFLGGRAGRDRTLTYGELYLEVQKFANVLKGLGVRKGDRVAVYMGMTPELAIALLACARIGAVHSVIFGGFAANALVDRINDAYCVAVITQDGSYRRGRKCS